MPLNQPLMNLDKIDRFITSRGLALVVVYLYEDT